VPTLAETMGAAYPELVQRQSYIVQVIKAEEDRFVRTLDQGLDRFAKIASDVKAKAKQVPGGTPGQAGSLPAIPGNEVFTLYDTYGFPTDLTRVLAEEQGLSIDEAGYSKHMEEQRERARSAAKFDGSFASDEGWTLIGQGAETEFVGYDKLEADVKVLRYREDKDQILVVLDKTPFYAESGGQVGDSGVLIGNGLELRVVDTIKVFDMVVHRCALVNGLLAPENLKTVKAKVDADKRFATLRNHSATHLLHAALRQVLGAHVQQQGSRVAPESLRFDFTHFQAMTAEETRRVEDIVNRAVQEDMPISHSVHGIDEAKQMGAMALFGEKYGERVRVIKMGGFSMELCGGTHAHATGQIGFFKIVSESSIAAGVRRIEAVTGPGAVELARKQFEALAEISKVFKTKPGQEVEKVVDAAARIKALEKEVAELRQAQAAGKALEYMAQAKDVNGFKVLLLSLDEKAVPKDSLTGLADGIAGRLKNVV
jgi:alanyl-tRNA synthetase